jgi:putative tryptophan/tyrosine transport system ATP-binding protein
MIRLTDVRKEFPGAGPDPLPALRSVNLEIGAGEFVTIIGTNGSGKSTLLNLIAGSILPDAGSIVIAGEEATRRRDFARAHAVARVFQNPFMGTAAEMTIAENLHLAWLRGSRRFPWIGLTAARRRAYREEVGGLEMQLEDRLDQPIGTLSGGQRQALTLLMATLTPPRVLLLDEHTAALDPKTAAQVIRLTERFIARGQLTALMVTHSMQQALELGTRMLMMHKGEIIEDIPAGEKRRLTLGDLLARFAELRKAEQLTGEMLDSLRREYL